MIQLVSLQVHHILTAINSNLEELCELPLPKLRRKVKHLPSEDLVLLRKWRRTLKCRQDAKMARTKKDSKIQQLEELQATQKFNHSMEISNLQIELNKANVEIQELRAMYERTKSIRAQFHEFFSMMKGIQQMFETMLEFKSKFETTVDSISVGFECAAFGQTTTLCHNQEDQPLNLCKNASNRLL